jgi:HAD superfamily hydrolase (TIGR01509 family)
MLKAVLLDVDGVLYDSMPLHAKAWIEACRKEGVRLPARLVYVTEGMKDRKVITFMLKQLSKKLPDETMDRICREKIRLFNAYPPARLIKGAKAFIRQLAKRKLKICLVTGSSQTQTAIRLRKDFGITRRFLVTGGDVTHGKPHPEPYQMALRRLKAKPREAVVVENAPLGIRSARRAGMRCFALKTGPLSKKELMKRAPFGVFDDFKQILSLLDES